MQEGEDRLSKLTVTLPSPMMERVKRVMPWGLRRHLVRNVMEKLLTLSEGPNKDFAHGMILSGQFQIVPDQSEQCQNLACASGKEAA